MSIFLAYLFSNMLRKNEVLDKFIIIGSIYYAISATVTIWVASSSPAGNDDAFLILQIGTFSEMLFLNAGIMYKSKMLQKQTIISQQLLIDRYSENQQLLLRLANIREKISRDLHDDVGATLSSIKAYAEILRQNPDNPVISELINNNSVEMIEKLDVIAWATDPQHDHINSLVAQMRKFALPICHSRKIECTIDNVNLEEACIVPGELRQNILLIFKEAIHNIIKYAQASSCKVNLSLADGSFHLTICDNGKGFDGEVKGNGNGWKNMRKRTTELGGTICIDSGLDRGTTIRLSLPYPFKIPDTWEKLRPGFA
jgi:signal transduction histidine kinase